MSPVVEEISPNIVELLYNQGIRNEGFASPIDTIGFEYNDWKYYSLFPDTDEPFGSLGSFFDKNPMMKNGWVLNPPQVEYVLDKLNTQLDNIKNYSPIYVQMPLWHDSLLYQKLLVQGVATIEVNKDVIFLVGNEFSEDLINNILQITKGTIDEKDMNLQIVPTGEAFPFIEYEYNRYLLTEKYLKLLSKNITDSKIKYEIKKSLEKLFLNSYNKYLESNPDPSITIPYLTFGPPTSDEFLFDLQDPKYINMKIDPVNLIKTMNDLVAKYAAIPANSNYPIMVKNDHIYYRKFISKEPRIHKFITKTNIPTTLNMLLRYGSIAAGGQQWAIPNNVAKILYEQGFRNEGFASPLNSVGIDFKDWSFCSLFYDTDRFFGSIGSFFNREVLQGGWSANPPYVEYIMNKMIALIEKSITLNSQFLAHIVIPTWKGNKLFDYLYANPNTKAIIDLKREKHYYVSEDKMILARFDSTAFLIGTIAVTPQVIADLTKFWAYE